MKQELKEAEQKQHDWAFVKTLISNIPLLKWVRNYGVDNLSENLDKLPMKENINTTEHSVFLMDSKLVKGLITNSHFKGTPLIAFSLAELKEIIDVCGSEGVLYVVDKDKPAIVEVVEVRKDKGKKEKVVQSNLIILAPRTK